MNHIPTHRILCLFQAIALWCFAMSTSGCANEAEVHARNLAQETLAHVTEYEESVRSLSRSLEHYYTESYGDIETAVLFEQSLDNGVVRNVAAGDLADQLSQRNLQDSDFRDIVRHVLALQAESRTKYTAQLDQLRAERKATLEQVASREERLKTVRTRLEKLQILPSTDDQIAQLRDFYEAASAAYSKTSK